MKEKDPNRIMFAFMETEEVYECVYPRRERSIEPPTTLRDEFVDMFGDIRFCFRGLYIGKGPVCASFSDEFETEDPIFCQKHIFFENIHALDTLLPETGCKSMVAVEILVQRP